MSKRRLRASRPHWRYLADADARHDNKAHSESSCLVRPRRRMGKRSWGQDKHANFLLARGRQSVISPQSARVRVPQDL
ncbi:unnamed protein product [Protopolystoma xenopodis]|uniref:Uncharacterized protein n=1 Tax=Protopolystoma xenopodis TaxID=117903 RepID=A0A3S5AS62_9PLAT|nr:unnamed protein product [Protopolystoma xenopodis]